VRSRARIPVRFHAKFFRAQLENDPNTVRGKSRSPSSPVRARREKLFKRINALPTVYEILSGKASAGKPKLNKKPPVVAQVRLPLASLLKLQENLNILLGVPNALLPPPAASREKASHGHGDESRGDQETLPGFHLESRREFGAPEQRPDRGTRDTRRTHVSRFPAFLPTRPDAPRRTPKRRLTGSPARNVGFRGAIF